VLYHKPNDCGWCRKEKRESEGPWLECGPKSYEGEENCAESSEHLKKEDQMIVRLPICEAISNIDV